MRQATSTRHYLVTGGAGFIGSAVVARLLQGGNYVTVVDRLMYGAEGCLAHFSNPHFRLIAVDINDAKLPQLLLAAGKDGDAPAVDGVLHLAAAVGHNVCQGLGRETVYQINVDGAAQMLALAEQLGAGRFVFASTCSVYGRTHSRISDEAGILEPVSLYGESKQAAEVRLINTARGMSCRLLVFRLASVFGVSPRMRFDVLVNQLVRQVHGTGQLVLFHPEHYRPFIHIQDVVDGLLAGLDADDLPSDVPIINLGSEKNCVTKQQLAEQIQTVFKQCAVQVSTERLSPPDQDVRLSFLRLQDLLGFQARRSLIQGIEEVSTALQQGWFFDQAERFHNQLVTLPI